MKIIKGDTILVTQGKDKGKKGKVLRGFPKENKILVENVNIKKERKRAKKEGEKGQTVEVPMPFPVSKVRMICPKCTKLTRIGYQKQEKNRIRVCKKCKQII
ncbi:50S ribosomal protein L24 [bacterium (Candidatus Gribaldobacteria) CG23_combo_of_CG06-09_8_20_14_all_37_87_8]|uniref:Large ribosomal subunit protein uL24 n=2 Tax=Candidatus Gribaldobacteria TaxID=2798536 RepID=A0A2G9ZFS7_9BACT|nr:MAG: 50S ribosomal protein L24 [Parcubacteria group bacterium CG1_02_37_13]PIP32023.1 MAG: 50S ribosomal protein L24 [bacterium (Candidatus Gribaldobacteria) CG23_combo_of_CG06-09_8_20_14_all_37_87_8]PIR90120.1 MAG: 50S ribosomal protein L24 [bacterium (Candidatus Gribaldobacteria) CG10_big_fil_rev_8_21_14_0_10_37_21]